MTYRDFQDDDTIVTIEQAIERRKEDKQNGFINYELEKSSEEVIPEEAEKFNEDENCKMEDEDEDEAEEGDENKDNNHNNSNEENNNNFMSEDSFLAKIEKMKNTDYGLPNLARKDKSKSMHQNVERETGITLGKEKLRLKKGISKEYNI